MLTLQDCLDFCDIPQDLVEEIAQHDHLPLILAAELAMCLSCAPGGLHVIHRYLCDNAAAACRCPDRMRRAHTTQTLSNFEQAHPELRQ